MATPHYNVAPRYTAGSPAIVDARTAERVAAQEKNAIVSILESYEGERAAERARRLGLRGIVECRTERLAEAKAQPPVDPETLALIDAAIALLPDEFGLGGHPGARCRVSRTERACVTRHADGTASVTLWIERYLGVQGWEPFVWSTPENLIGDLRAWEQQPICDEEEL